MSQILQDFETTALVDQWTFNIIPHKAKLFAKKTLNKLTCENIQTYKSFNNTFNTLKRKMKASYYRQIPEEQT